MNISANFKLEPTLEILQVWLESILYDDLLRLNVLDVAHAICQLDGSNPGGAGEAGDAWQRGYSGDGRDSVSTLEVDNIGHGLLSDKGYGPEPRGAERHPHHLPGEQPGPVRDEEAPHALSPKSADGKRFWMI